MDFVRSCLPMLRTEHVSFFLIYNLYILFSGIVALEHFYCGCKIDETYKISMRKIRCPYITSNIFFETKKEKLMFNFNGYANFKVILIFYIFQVFFVLRKKQSQVTFLHVYHHTNLAVSTWAYLKYVKGSTLKITILK